MRTVRGSAPDVVIGLAHQVMFPLVAEPDTGGALAPEEAPDELPLLHAEMARTAARPAAAVRIRPRLRRAWGIMRMASLPFAPDSTVREPAPVRTGSSLCGRSHVSQGAVTGQRRIRRLAVMWVFERE
jgi:hypothetical protein